MRGGVPLPGTRCRPQPRLPCLSYPAPHRGTCLPRRSRRPLCALRARRFRRPRRSWRPRRSRHSGRPVCFALGCRPHRRVRAPRYRNPGGSGPRGGRRRRQEEQAPRKEPCRPPYDMSHSLQSRYFDRTSYEFLRECKALIRKNTPRVFCFVGSGFSVPLRPAGFALPGFFPACFGILARAVAGYRGTLPVVTRNRHFAREAGITRTEVLPPPE